MTSPPGMTHGEPPRHPRRRRAAWPWRVSRRKWTRLRREEALRPDGASRQCADSPACDGAVRSTSASSARSSGRSAGVASAAKVASSGLQSRPRNRSSLPRRKRRRTRLTAMRASQARSAAGSRSVPSCAKPTTNVSWTTSSPSLRSGQQSGRDGQQVVRVSAIDDIPAPAITGERTANQLAIAERGRRWQNGKLRSRRSHPELMIPEEARMAQRRAEFRPRAGRKSLSPCASRPAPDHEALLHGGTIATGKPALTTRY